MALVAFRNAALLLVTDEVVHVPVGWSNAAVSSNMESILTLSSQPRPRRGARGEAFLSFSLILSSSVGSSADFFVSIFIEVLDECGLEMK